MEEIYRSLLHIFFLVILSGMVSAGCVAGGEGLSLEWAFNTSDVFPGRTFGAGHQSPPVVFDLDGDGANEAIWGTRRGDSKRMWCISEDGELEWIYPPINQAPLPGDPTSKVSLVDVDGDGEYEAVFAGRGGVLNVIDGKGNLVWRWFNPSEGIAMHGPPQAFDVDGNGYVEFFMNDMEGFLHRVDHEGNLVWTSLQNADGNPRPPTIADVDQDGSYEVLLACQDHNVYAYSADDGRMLWTFDTEANMQANPVIVADVNSDEEYEVVVWTDAPTSAVICLTCNGYELWRWVLPREGNIRLCQAMGDVDDDGNLDMVIMSSVAVFCIDISGSSPSTKWEANFTDWMVEGRLPPGAKADQWSSYQLLADMDGDGSLEVLLLAPYPIVLDASTGELETYYLNEYIAVNRRQENGGWWGDVDRDGVSEWICELNGKNHPETQVYCFTMEGIFPAKSPWPEYYHSALPPLYQAKQGISLISAYSNSLWFPLEVHQPGFFFSVFIHTDKDWYIGGQTVTITASVTNASRPVLDAGVRFKITRPDQYKDGPFSMYDDGTHGDITSGDGVYTAYYDIGQDHPAGNTYIEVNATQDDLAASQRRTFQVFGYADLGVHNVDTDERFASIQEAIDDPDTVSGHTITVESGTYYERVVVTKSLRIMGLDTGTGDPVIDGGGNGVVVTLSADGIIIEGFNITNSGIRKIGIEPPGIKVISGNNTVRRNEVNINNGGIYIESSGFNNITDNYIHDNRMYAIYLYEGSSHNTITDNYAADNDKAVYLLDSSHNTITNNDFPENWRAILLENSHYNTIIGNNATDGHNVGIDLDLSQSNVVARNNVTNNRYWGIRLESSSNNTLIENLVGNSGITGIRLYLSGGCTLRNNAMFGNLYNFGVEGVNHTHFDNDIDTSNTAEGRPIYYLVGVSNQVIDPSSNPATIYCFNCSNMTVRDLTLTNNGEGIFFYNTTDSTIENNQIGTNRRTGITLLDCSNSTITNNTVTDQQRGINLESSNHTTITNNTVTNNDYGIYLSNCDNNTISFNAVTQSKVSTILLSDSDNNTIAHNTVNGNRATGIGFYDSDYNTVTDNTVRNNEGSGIWMSGSWNRITHNEVGNSGWSGIRIGRSSTYNEVSWNTVTSNHEHGIHLVNADFNTILGNTLRVNEEAGICLRECINNLVLNNTISGNDLGIWLSSHSQDVIISQCNIIQGNNQTGNRHTDTDNAVLGEEEEAGCLLGVAEFVIKLARGLNTAPYQALLQRGYEEFDKGYYSGAKQYAREVITLRFQIWEGSMLGLLLLIPLLVLCRRRADECEDPSGVQSRRTATDQCHQALTGAGDG